jgi:hypothetical protein
VSLPSPYTKSNAGTLFLNGDTLFLGGLDTILIAGYIKAILKHQILKLHFLCFPGV